MAEQSRSAESVPAFTGAQECERFFMTTIPVNDAAWLADRTAAIRESISALKQEREEHRRREKTLLLAIQAMEGELDLMERNWAQLPPEVEKAFESVKSVYGKPSRYV